MKVTGKPVPTSVGLFFIGLALIAAGFIFPGAKGHSPPFCISAFSVACLSGFLPHWESASLLRIDGSERLDECYALIATVENRRVLERRMCENARAESGLLNHAITRCQRRPIAATAR